jgi:hypothetical protein
MHSVGSIFLQFNLPNATTWFYFSALLSVALFFKFSRFLSVRNWDVLSFFLLAPGFLFIQEAHQYEAAAAAAHVTAGAGRGLASCGVGGAVAAAADPTLRPSRELWVGYLWLMCGSGYFFVRCLLDLALVRRPALAPNLNLSGLVWMAGALYTCLVAVAVRQPHDTPPKAGKSSAALDRAQKSATDLVQQQTSQGTDARFWVARTLAMLCHLSVVVGLVVIGLWHFQDAHAGMAAATGYLLLPFTAFHVAQVEVALPMALIVWTVVAYRRPFLAGSFLGLAAGVAYFPILLFPVWLSFYRRCGSGRFAAGFGTAACLSLAAVGALLWFDGTLDQTVRSALALSDWQAWKAPTGESFWRGSDGAGLYWAYRIPIFFVYFTFVVATTLWPSPKNLAQVLALSAAVLIGTQFWYADQGGIYVLWYLPFLLLLVFRPNLADRVPPALPAQTTWLTRIGQSFRRAAVFLFRRPAPTTNVG